MINKSDYMWLERHTEILNVVPDLDDFATESVKFKVYRPTHIQKIKDIFSNYPCVCGKNKEDTWIKVKGLTLDNLNDIACSYYGDLIYDTFEHGVYYIPANKRRNQRILRRANPRLLANLSNRKKLDILFAYAQTLFPTDKQRLFQNEFIKQNSKKFISLLQLKIPHAFMDKEYQKLQKITDKISSIPNISKKLSDFNQLSLKEKQYLIEETSRITATVNCIEPPKIHYLSQKQINNDKQIAEWVETDAFADFKDIYLNKNFIKKYSGIECLSLAFHETNHIAQSQGDYKEFPEIEEMFSPHLNYLQNYAETYLSIPIEVITYNLEKEFCNQIAQKTQTKTNSSFYETEYDIAKQYLNKSLRRAY